MGVKEKQFSRAERQIFMPLLPVANTIFYKVYWI
jgi:hypothetical protein